MNPVCSAEPDLLAEIILDLQIDKFIFRLFLIEVETTRRDATLAKFCKIFALVRTLLDQRSMS